MIAIIWARFLSPKKNVKNAIAQFKVAIAKARIKEQ